MVVCTVLHYRHRSAFSPVEKALAEAFLPTLFRDEIDAGKKLRNILAMPIKWAVITIPDPTATAKSNYDGSIIACSHLLDTFQGVKKIQPSTHTSVISEVRDELKIRTTETHSGKLDEMSATLTCDDRRTILRGKGTGQWLSTLPSTVSGTEMSTV